MRWHLVGRTLLAACMLHASVRVVLDAVWHESAPGHRLRGSPSTSLTVPAIFAQTQPQNVSLSHLHFVWPSGAFPSAAQNIDGWKALHPSWRVTVWSEADIAQQFSDLPRAGSALSHVLRFRILAEFGGIIVDPDITAVRPLDELLRQVQDSGGQAFSVCRELNQYHPIQSQRPVAPPPGVFHGRKCHRMDDAVIGAPKGDPVIKRAFADAMNMNKTNNSPPLEERADAGAMMWTRLLGHNLQQDERTHWRVLASRTFFGNGCIRGRMDPPQQCARESGADPSEYARHYFDLNRIRAWSGRTTPVSTGGEGGEWIPPEGRQIALHAPCFPAVEMSQVRNVLTSPQYSHRTKQSPSLRLEIQILYHDAASLAMARRFEHYDWARLRKMEQSVYFESAAVLAASESETANWTSHGLSYVGYLPYSILKKQRFTGSNISLPSLVHCSSLYGARRCDGVGHEATWQRAGAGLHTHTQRERERERERETERERLRILNVLCMISLSRARARARSLSQATRNTHNPLRSSHSTNTIGKTC